MFFAGAAEFEEDLPAVEKAARTVVILRLRGIDDTGRTFLWVLPRYTVNLKANQAKLVLTDVSEPIDHQLQKTGLLDQLGDENVYSGISILGDSTLEDYRDANAWLKQGENEIDS